jgi:hypothetical protein
LYILDRFDVLMSNMIFKKWKNIIDMYFDIKSYLKSTRNHTAKHAFKGTRARTNTASLLSFLIQAFWIILVRYSVFHMSCWNHYVITGFTQTLAIAHWCFSCHDNNVPRENNNLFIEKLLNWWALARHVILII